ncbi:MAG: aminotransferase class V-fold PLP-dependent enzyme, partial [Thalassolituus sp.]
MYLNGNDNAKGFDETSPRLQQLARELLEGFTNEQPLVTFENLDDLYEQYDEDTLFLVQDGIINLSSNDTTILSYEEGDLIGISQSFHQPSLTLSTDGYVELQPINRDDFLLHIYADKRRQHCWSHYLVTLNSMLTNQLAEITRDQVKPVAGFMNFSAGEMIIRQGDDADMVYTIISGSIMLPEVREAMAEASKSYVHIEELMEAVGARIAELMQCEWALVTNGCAAALSQLTAACIAGTNADHIKQLPDTTGLKNRVLYQPGHLHAYTHAIRAVGAQLVEVDDHDALALAIDDKTAMFAFFGDRADDSNISLEDVVAICHRKNIPVLVDAAAERPNVPNVYLKAGADMVAYSGGKCLRGPQSAGLVLGRKDLLQAAFANGAPHHSIGRAMKAGKEEIMGLLAAVEKWVERDHDAEWREWERRLDLIADA